MNDLLIYNLSILYEHEDIIHGKKTGLISLEHISKLQKFDYDNPYEFLDLAYSYSHKKHLQKKLEFSDRYNLSVDKSYAKKKV